MRKIQAVWVAALLCGSLTAYGKDAGWQWYNAPVKLPDPKTTDKSAQVRQEPDIMQKLSALQTATKRALYEAILYPGVDNFVKYFRLQNYWTQQAGLFSMSAKKAMLAHPELDYNLQYSHYNGTVRNQLAADQAQQRQAISKLAEHYGIMFFYRGQDPIDGQLAQVINGFRATYGLSVIPVTVDGVINPMLPDTRPDQGQAQRLGVKYFPAMMLVDPKQGSVRPLSYGFITQDDLAKQFLNVSEDFKPNF
ncbi:type-F conjugative transfer system pilin assembly protein TraF [Salmonella enterica subsp. enterica serovar Give]|nr:type-F conjugative transfer system pilin assembly protein TraF [Salmonella enterica subsp. enterica serovar Give]EDG5395272.1 type-F conjugative transfer system pilin assembly protein TraF [Salmonella enterica subsp. enterica serovar Bovismorbificans]EDK9786881.1 type-F conjugative transfer system pilin assembly protein TraF [Salmonella enterica subsp. enterica serovar Give]EGZ3891508.1 type-F conjugative transfer system pilin assembly protein TraF [Salmonella enterica subsp. enterica serovar